MYSTSTDQNSAEPVTSFDGVSHTWRLEHRARITFCEDVFGSKVALRMGWRTEFDYEETEVWSPTSPGAELCPG